VARSTLEFRLQAGTVGIKLMDNAKNANIIRSMDRDMGTPGKMALLVVERDWSTIPESAMALKLDTVVVVQDTAWRKTGLIFGNVYQASCATQLVSV
jgi:hypothetical protein